MIVFIDTCLDGVSNEHGVSISGSIILRAYKGRNDLGAREFTCSFFSDNPEDITTAIQSLEVRAGEQTIAFHRGQFCKGILLDLDPEAEFCFRLFSSVLTRFLLEGQDICVKMKVADLIPPEDAFLLNLWRGSLNS